MKNVSIILILLITVLFSGIGYSQIEKANKTKKSVIGIWPSQVEKVDGVMFSFWPKHDNKNQLINKEIKLPTTNGLELNLNPMGILVPMVLPYFFFDSQAREPIKDTLDLEFIKYYKKINGLQIAMLNMDPTIMNGVEIHLMGSVESIVNGISVGFLYNKRDQINGLGLGLLGNFDTEVNGVQIGLLNTTHKLKGFQFGLWNKNEKRSLPFINWNF